MGNRGGVAVILLLCLFFACSAHAFYFPGIAPRDFHKDDELQVKVNKLSSTKTQLPYDTVIACSTSCDGRKSVALLAPVVSELYHCLMEEKEFHGKAKREIEGFCGSKPHSDANGSAGFLSCFMDLVRVWSSRCPGSGDGSDVFSIEWLYKEKALQPMSGCWVFGYDCDGGDFLAEAVLEGPGSW